MRFRTLKLSLGIVTLLATPWAWAIEYITEPERQFGNGLITGLAIAPDGASFYAGSTDGFVRRWDTATHQLLQKYEGDGSWVYGVDISPDGTTLAAGFANRTAIIWDSETGDRRFVLGDSDIWFTPIAIARVQFSPSGNHLMTNDVGWYGIGLYDATTGENLVSYIRGMSMEYRMLYTPAGDQLVVSHFNGTISTWDAVTLEQLTTIEAHTEPVSSIAFNSDGSLLLSAGREGVARVWDFSTLELLYEVDEGIDPSLSITSLFSGNDNSILVSSTDSEGISFFDYTNGNLLNTIPRALFYDQLVQSQERLLFVTPDNLLELWDTDSVTLIDSFTVYDPVVNQVAFVLDHSRFAAGDEGGTVRIIDVESGNMERSFKAHFAIIRTMISSPDGTKVITATDSGELRVWDVSSGAMLHDLVGHTDRVTAMAVSMDSTLLLTGSRDHTARLWSMETGELLQVLSGHADGVSTVDINPDATLLVTGSLDQSVRIWDRESGHLVREITTHTDEIAMTLFTPTFPYLLTQDATEDPVLWHLETGNRVRGNRRSLFTRGDSAFMSDGRVVVTNPVSAIRATDFLSGQPLRVFSKYGLGIADIAVSSTNEWLLSVEFGVVFLWDLSELSVPEVDPDLYFPHAADQNGDGRIALSELLRVVQLYAVGAHHCMDGTEDGFSPREGNVECAYHDSDYNPTDWSIDLGELLRLIQLYNAGSYHACHLEGSEDSFCLGPRDVD